MSLKQSKSFWFFTLALGILFSTLMSIRLELISGFSVGKKLPATSWTGTLPERDTWKIISQNGEKIGYSHKTINPEEQGYRLTETVFMRIKTMGMVQNLHFTTTGFLKDDLSLSRFEFFVRSGLFNHSLNAVVSKDILTVSTRGSGNSRTFDIKLEHKPYLAAGVVEAVKAEGFKSGDSFSFMIFDPATLGQERLHVRVLEKEHIYNMGKMRETTRLSIDFKGSVQQAWIDHHGEIIREKGLMGISLERAARETALAASSAEPGQDLVQAVSIRSNIKIENKTALEKLAVKLSGVDRYPAHLHGGRQVLNGDYLTVNLESLEGLPQGTGSVSWEPIAPEDLASDPFIQSDHQKIRDQVRNILDRDDTPLNNARKIMGWIQRNIKKQPVISIPSALATLENRMGDCNEHAVLYAALLRAAGIPARVETGLVYIKGRFYYHAWNLVHVGKWVTADSVFNQIPSDVTHIRFASGLQKQLDLMGIMGRINIEVLGIE